MAFHLKELRGKEGMMKDGGERGPRFEVQVYLDPSPEPQGLPSPPHTPLTQTGSSH